jgi:hypothetical protein
MSITPFFHLLRENQDSAIKKCFILVTPENILQPLLLSLNFHLPSNNVTVLTASNSFFQGLNLPHDLSINLKFTSKETVIDLTETSEKTFFIVDLYLDLKLPTINYNTIKNSQSSILFLIHHIDNLLLMYLYSSILGQYNLFSSDILHKPKKEIGNMFQSHMFKLYPSITLNKNQSIIVEVDHPLFFDTYQKKKKYENSFTNAYVARNSIVVGKNKFHQPIIKFKSPTINEAIINEIPTASSIIPVRQICNFVYSSDKITKLDLPFNEDGWITYDIVQNILNNNNNNNNDYYSPKLSYLLKNIIESHTNRHTKSLIYTSYIDKYGSSLIETCLRFLGLNVISITNDLSPSTKSMLVKQFNIKEMYQVLIIIDNPHFPINVEEFHIFEQKYEMKECVHDIIKLLPFNTRIKNYISKIKDNQIIKGYDNTPDYEDYLKIQRYYSDIDNNLDILNDVSMLVNLS